MVTTTTDPAQLPRRDLTPAVPETTLATPDAIGVLEIGGKAPPASLAALGRRLSQDKIPGHPRRRSIRRLLFIVAMLSAALAGSVAYILVLLLKPKSASWASSHCAFPEAHSDITFCTPATVSDDGRQVSQTTIVPHVENTSALTLTYEANLIEGATDVILSLDHEEEVKGVGCAGNQMSIEFTSVSTAQEWASTLPLISGSSNWNCSLDGETQAKIILRVAVELVAQSGTSVTYSTNQASILDFLQDVNISAGVLLVDSSTDAGTESYGRQLFVSSSPKGEVSNRQLSEGGWWSWLGSAFSWLVNMVEAILNFTEDFTESCFSVQSMLNFVESTVTSSLNLLCHSSQSYAEYADSDANSICKAIQGDFDQPQVDQTDFTWNWPPEGTALVYDNIDFAGTGASVYVGHLFELSMQSWALQSAKFEVHSKGSLSVKATISESASWEYSHMFPLLGGGKTLGTFNFMVGPVPFSVSVLVDAGIHLQGDSNMEAHVVTGATANLDSKFGVEYTTADGWQPIASNDHYTNFTPPTATFNADAKAAASLIPSFILDVDFIGGPNASIVPYIGASASASIDSSDPSEGTCQATIYWGTKLKVGAEIDIKDPFTNSDLGCGMCTHDFPTDTVWSTGPHYIFSCDPCYEGCELMPPTPPAPPSPPPSPRPPPPSPPASPAWWNPANWG